MPGKPDPARAGAIKAWEEAFGSPPPLYLSVAFMQKAVQYAQQCKDHGGLSTSVARAMRQVAEGKPVPESVGTTLRPGSHLVRQWNGRTYQVEVLDKGYRMDGKTWASLTALARHITGTNWSGPRFFGLTSRNGSSS